MVVEGNISLLTDADENPIGTVAINRDVTERKKIEKNYGGFGKIPPGESQSGFTDLC